MALAWGVASVGLLSAEEPHLLRLWEGTPPLAVVSGKPEAALPLDAGMDPDIMRIGNVTEPTLEMFHPPAWLLCEGNRRTAAYPAAADEPSVRPDFGILVYPAYLASKDGPPPPVVRAEEKPGPVFLVHADDDRLSSENSLQFYLALKRTGVGAELHVYQQGGHGFGMLPRGLPVHAWPSRCEEWLRAQKLVAPLR